MEYLQRAFQAVQRNLSSLGLYLVIVVGASAAGTALFTALGISGDTVRGNVRLFACAVAVDLLLVLANAIAQAIVFSRFAKDMDRPLWRMRDDREALRRYFLLWLAFNGVVFLLNLLSYDVPILIDNEEFGAIPQLLALFAVALYIPLGAAMMFHGTADWRRIPESLGPYGRHFAKVMLVCCAAGFLYLMMLDAALRMKEHPLLRLVVDVILGYGDCVIFCAAWMICMHDRQNPEDSSFDF